MPQVSRTVLIVTDDLTPHGAGVDVRLLIAQIVREGMPVRVVCEEVETSLAGISVRESPGLGSRWRRPWALSRVAADEGATLPGVIHVLKSSMADVAVSLSERWGVPYFLTIDEFLGPGDRLRLGKRWCKGLFATGEELAADLIHQVGIPASMVHVVRPGSITTTGDRKSPPSTTLQPISVVGAAGPLSAGSGFATFLNAARRVLDTGIDAEFVIAGSGEDEIELRRRADRFKIADRVTFAADASIEDPVWGVLDIYCQPAVVASVGRGLRFALANAIPSIASDIEGLRDLVEHDETGLRVPPNDTNALAGAILALLRDRARAESLGRSGRERIERDFRPEVEAKLIVEHYRAAISEANPPIA